MPTAVLAMAVLAYLTTCCATDGFWERFNGHGNYTSLYGTLSGLDNPGWEDINTLGEITSTGYHFSVEDLHPGDVTIERLRREAAHLGDLESASYSKVLTYLRFQQGKKLLTRALFFRTGSENGV